MFASSVLSAKFAAPTTILPLLELSEPELSELSSPHALRLSAAATVSTATTRRLRSISGPPAFCVPSTGTRRRVSGRGRTPLVFPTQSGQPLQRKTQVDYESTTTENQLRTAVSN